VEKKVEEMSNAELESIGFRAQETIEQVRTSLERQLAQPKSNLDLVRQELNRRYAKEQNEKKKEVIPDPKADQKDAPKVEPRDAETDGLKKFVKEQIPEIEKTA